MSMLKSTGGLTLTIGMNEAIEGGASGGLRQKVAKVWSVIGLVVPQQKVSGEHQGAGADVTIEGRHSEQSADRGIGHR